MTMAVKRNSLHSLLLLGVAFSASVLAQSDPLTQLTVSPEGIVQPGTKITLTCEFKLTEQDLHYLRFDKDNSLMLEYTQESGLVPAPSLASLEHGKDFTTDGAKFWMSFLQSFCGEEINAISYKCSIQDTLRNPWEVSKSVTFAGPSLEVTMDGQKINDPLTLEHDVIGIEKALKLAAANYPEEISVLQLQINGAQLAGSLVPNNKEDICVYGGEISGSYTFPKAGVYQLEYTLKTKTGDPIPKIIAVTVKDKTTTPSTTKILMTQSTTSLTPTPTDRGNPCKEASLALMIIGILMALSGGAIFVMIRVFNIDIGLFKRHHIRVRDKEIETIPLVILLIGIVVFVIGLIIYLSCPKWEKYL